MESSRERKRNAWYKAVAICMTLLFHIALFGGLYYLMDSPAEQAEVTEQESVQSVDKQARS